MRFLPREWPEPFQHIAIGEQIPPRAKLTAHGAAFCLVEPVPDPGAVVRHTLANRNGSTSPRNQSRSLASRPSV